MGGGLGGGGGSAGKGTERGGGGVGGSLGRDWHLLGPSRSPPPPSRLPVKLPAEGVPAPGRKGPQGWICRAREEVVLQEWGGGRQVQRSISKKHSTEGAEQSLATDRGWKAGRPQDTLLERGPPPPPARGNPGEGGGIPSDQAASGPEIPQHRTPRWGAGVEAFAGFRQLVSEVVVEDL